MVPSWDSGLRRAAGVVPPRGRSGKSFTTGAVEGQKGYDMGKTYLLPILLDRHTVCRWETEDREREMEGELEREGGREKTNAHFNSVP